MRQLFLLITFLVCYHTSFGQTEFGPLGAQWVYYLPPNGGPFYPETEDVITVSGDTVIDGLQAKRLTQLRRTVDHWNGGSETTGSWNHYVSNQGDSILSYENEQWELIFDTGVSVGDTLIVYVGELNALSCSLRDTVAIESIQDSLMYGETLRYYSFNVFGFNERVPGGFFEKIGFTYDSPIKHPVYCDFPGSYWGPWFYCYSDNEVTISPTSGCGQILWLSEKEASSLEISLLAQNLQIQSSPNSTLHIYDILGKELLQQRITSDNQTLNISQLPNGILMVVVEMEGGRFTKKVIKTSY
ncbi:MAG: T9SS type A sorting domain-containing protein [Flavobacteriales bacterium]|nr:T9SS type A sorting domain-containing protein [Flavobacteriales bacterium]MCB9192641.1 T9SS type A sorting domain-containing protein [Flavobacteriales bacterium]